MLESIEFKNFKCLRDAKLPLGRFTLIIGPNGSGKSTALAALGALAAPGRFSYRSLLSKQVTPSQEAPVEVTARWDAARKNLISFTRWFPSRSEGPIYRDASVQTRNVNEGEQRVATTELEKLRIYSFDPRLMANPGRTQGALQLQQTGENLASTLDALDDLDRDRFNALQDELAHWMPEFDQISFDPSGGQKMLQLRTRVGRHKIEATDLSDGTLLALGMLTVAYLPDAPPLVGFEEPDRGLHPRLMRQVRDAIYRLAYPEDHGEKRPPVQVIATTHSPYMVDQFREHPEEIVIAEKVGNEAKFSRLIDMPHYEDIIRDASLGELWYTGVLGGVPLHT